MTPKGLYHLSLTHHELFFFDIIILLQSQY